MRAISCWDSVHSPPSCVRTQSVGGSVFCSALVRAAPFPFLHIAHLCRGRRGSALPSLALSCKMPVLGAILLVGVSVILDPTSDRLTRLLPELVSEESSLGRRQLG